MTFPKRRPRVKQSERSFIPLFSDSRIYMCSATKRRPDAEWEMIGQIVERCRLDEV